MDRISRPPWRAAVIFVMAALVILTGNAAADQMQLDPNVGKLASQESSSSTDAADGATMRIGSVLEKMALPPAPKNGTVNAFTRWLKKQRCVDGDSGRKHRSALVCAHECDVLYFGWSDENVSQLKLVAGSALLSSESPLLISVGPDGWSLRNYHAGDPSSLRCLVNPKPRRALAPWTRRRVKRLSVLAPDAAKELGQPMHLERLHLDVRDWVTRAPRRYLGQRLSDEQLAEMVAALLTSPAVQQLWFTWTPAVRYPAVLEAVDQSLASNNSAVKHLQIVETGDGLMESVEQELVPSLLEHTPAGNWTSVTSVAIKWTSTVALEQPNVRFDALRKLSDRLPNLRSKHSEPNFVPLDEQMLDVLPRLLTISGQTRSVYWGKLYAGVTPDAVGAATESLSYASQLMLPWQGVDGIPRYSLNPLGYDLGPFGTETLRNTSTLTLYAALPDVAAPSANGTADLAIGNASRLERLVVESGEDGVFCNEIVQRLPPVLPASTRDLLLRTFDLAETADADAALTRLEAILAGNPGLANVTVGLHLPCGNSTSALLPLDRITAAVQAKSTPTALQIELSTSSSCTQLFDVYSKRIHAAVPFANVLPRTGNVDDVATRLHSGSLLY